MPQGGGRDQRLLRCHVGASERRRNVGGYVRLWAWLSRWAGALGIGGHSTLVSSAPPHVGAHEKRGQDRISQRRLPEHFLLLASPDDRSKVRATCVPRRLLWVWICRQPFRGFTRPCGSVNASQAHMGDSCLLSSKLFLSFKASLLVQGHWGVIGPGDQPATGTCACRAVQAERMGLSRPPGSAAAPPALSNPAAHRIGLAARCLDGELSLVSEKSFGIELLAALPQHEHRVQDFARSVLPRMGFIVGALETGGVELVDRAGSLPHRRQPGAVANGLEHTVAASIQLLKAQRLAVATAIADAQPAVAEELLRSLKTAGFLDVGHKQMCADAAYPRYGVQ